MSRPLLRGSSYDPARGGHAPGDLRASFSDVLDAVKTWAPGDLEPALEFRERPVTASQICGLLWNCHDILPGDLWDQINDLRGDEGDGPQARTYGSAARWVKQRITATRR